MSELLRSSEIVKLVTTGILAFSLLGCAPDAHVGTRTDLPLEGTAPSGFPFETITSGVETFSTGNPGDMSIPRSEMTDQVGEPLQNSTSGSVDGIPNPQGMVNVIVSSVEAWLPADENGYPKEEYTALK